MKRIYYICLLALIGILYTCEDVQMGPKDPGVPWEMGPITEYSINPVSYTHLDVYKRQEQHLA